MPLEAQRSTPLYLKATAGVRLIPTELQRRLFTTLYQNLTQPLDGADSCPFSLNREDIGVISGEEEAYFAALSVNYLAGRIDGSLRPLFPDDSRALGALDLGGASTQITFQTSASKITNSTAHLSGSLPVEPSACPTTTKPSAPEKLSHADFVSRSYLSYGVDQMRFRLWKRLLEAGSPPPPGLGTSGGHAPASTPNRTVANPCGFVGQVTEYEGARVVGVGDAEACRALIEEALFPCPGGKQAGCALGGAENSGLPDVAGAEFVAMSVFFFATDAVRALGHLGPSSSFSSLPSSSSSVHSFFARESGAAHAALVAGWPTPTTRELRAAAADFCAADWGHVERAGDLGLHEWSFPEQLPNRCFESLFIASLIEGYGVSPDARAVTFAATLGGMEVEWTLGFALTALGSDNSL